MRGGGFVFNIIIRAESVGFIYMVEEVCKKKTLHLKLTALMFPYMFQPSIFSPDDETKRR